MNAGNKRLPLRGMTCMNERKITSHEDVALGQFGEAGYIMPVMGRTQTQAERPKLCEYHNMHYVKLRGRKPNGG